MQHPGRPPESSANEQFRPDLEGLRGIAVVLVVLFHSGTPWFGGGYLGVDAFFVLSGFLITSILVREQLEAGRISLVRFYARRVRRLLPAALVVAAATFVAVARWTVDPIERTEAWTDGVATLLSVANIRFALVAADYFAPETSPSPFLQMWSLGVEEQFYLFWPALLILGFAGLGRHRRRLAIAVGIGAAISFALFATEVLGAEATFYSLPTRAWELGIGAVAALIGRRFALSSSFGLALLLAGVVIASIDASLDAATSLAVSLGAVVVIVGRSEGALGGRLLESAPVRALGRISYSLYLWHWPLLLFVGPRLGIPVAVVLSLVFAAVTERFVERPIRTGMWPRLAARGALGAGIAAIVLSAGTAWLVRPTLGETVYLPGSGTPAEQPVAIRPSLVDLKDDTTYAALGACYAQRGDSSPPPTGCLFGAPEGELRIALVGDSFAAQWFPALAEIADRSDATLLALAKTGCPQLLEPTRFVTTLAPYANCAEFSEAVRERLEAFKPDLIVTSYGDFALNSENVRNAAAEIAAMRAGLQRLAAVAPVVYIAPIPALGQNPVSCLDASRDNAFACGVDLEDARAQPIHARDREVLRSLAVANVDPAPLFCDVLRCRVVDEGGIVRYRDATHVSATYSAAAWSELRALLVAAGAPLP